MTAHANRVFGLDLMRALAIVLVVFAHNVDMLRAFVPGAPQGMGTDGVDLFFVLSGYLIGGILLEYCALEGVPWWRRALDFWQRRWLRTLPNYYLFLVINIVLVHIGIGNGLLNHNTWGYAFFLQDLWKSLGLFFWESWSLVVEEWFYFLFPILLFAVGVRLRLPARTGFVGVVLAFIVLPTLVRLSMAHEATSISDLELGARHLVITRLDTIGYGVLAAWLHTAWMLQWKRVRWVAFMIGVAALVMNASLYGNDALYYSSTFFFTTNAVAMVLLLPLLSTWKRVPPGGSIVVFISRVSYALYLVHIPVRYFWNRLYWDRTPTEGVLLWIAYWVVSITVAWLLYRFWERRFMALRDPISKRILGAPLTPSS